MHKSLLFYILLTTMFGCAQSQVIRTDSEVKQEFPPTSPDSIEIYKSLKPQWNYTEIGMITLRNIGDIERIMEKSRIEAGKKGANAIIGFEIDSESEIVTVTESQTSSEGVSSTVSTDEHRVYYSASGTLVRKIQDGK